jgi:hypothetical protein
VSASHGRTTSAMDTTTKTVASVTAPVLINTKVSALKTSISAFVCRCSKMNYYLKVEKYFVMCCNT